MRNLSQNFRYGPLARESYPSPLLDTTNLPQQRLQTEFAGFLHPEIAQVIKDRHCFGYREAEGAADAVQR